MGSVQERSKTGAAPAAEPDERADAEKTWRDTIETHSRLLVAALGTLSAALMCVAAGLGVWAARAASERDDLEGSQGTLESRVEALEAENAQLTGELEAAQDDLENQDEPENSAADDNATSDTSTGDDMSPGSDNSTSTYLTILEPVSGSWQFEGPVTIDGTDYSQGLSTTFYEVEPDETFEYVLSRDYARLTGTVGLADDSSSTAPGYVEIRVDGELRQSASLEYGDHVPIDVDLSDALRLGITVGAPRYGQVVALGDLMLES